MKTKQILIVEDNRTFRNLLKASLKSECPRLSVLEAASFHDAVSMIQHVDISFFLLDIQLPDGSGLELIPHIKMNHPQAFVLVLSTHDDEEFQASAFQYGANQFLSKQNFRVQDITHFIEC